jgi:hypothetical protein
VTTTYRYVSDGSLLDGMHRDGLARLLNPLVVSGFVVACLGFGVVLSLVTYESSLPTYLGKVLLIGLFWGALELLAVVVCVAVMVPTVRVLSRRVLARNYAAGLVTEVDLGDDALVVRRAAGSRTVPYGTVAQIKRRRAFLSIAVRGSLRPVLLPAEILPDDALDYVRTRSRGRVPAASVPPVAGEPSRRFVAPAGWAAHLAAVHLRSTLTGRAFWTRLGVALAVTGVAAVLGHPAWLVLAPAFAVLFVAVSYVQARRAFASAVPDGTEATTEFLEDRFISRNHGGVREIRYDDVRSVEVHGDVVRLRIGSLPGAMLIARALVTDDGLERLRRAPAG